MTPLPPSRPKHLSLGTLEAEIMQILWDFESATVKDIHERILADPDRDLAYASVTTVLNRLAQKGWVVCDKRDRAFVWTPTLSQQDAQMLKAHDHLRQFLSISNPDIVAAFADELDQTSLAQLDAIAARIRQARQQREGQ
jgi:predicted transcriptional regulator